MCIKLYFPLKIPFLKMPYFDVFCQQSVFKFGKIKKIDEEGENF